ncbi:MAG: hypothetical protein QXH00_10385, partial [Candidatus Jordarchaeales archaeon]
GNGNNYVRGKYEPPLMRNKTSPDEKGTATTAHTWVMDALCEGNKTSPDEKGTAIYGIPSKPHYSSQKQNESDEKGNGDVNDAFLFLGR